MPDFKISIYPEYSKTLSRAFEKGYVLSPAYDLTKTPEKFEHEMTVNGNGNPSEEDLLAVAEEFKLNLAESKEIIRNIRAICEQ